MKPEQEAINAMILRKNIINELTEIKTIEDAKTFINKAKTFVQYVKTTKQNAEIRFLAVEQEIRGQRICGKYIQEGQERGEIQDHGGARNFKIKDINLEKKSLSEIGLTPYESMIFQQIASIPEEEFEEAIEESRAKISDAINDLSTAKMVRLAKELSKEEKPKQEKDINELVDDLSDSLQAFLNSFAIVTSHWENVDAKRREKLGIKLKRLISIFQELQESQREKNSKKPKLLQNSHDKE